MAQGLQHCHPTPSPLPTNAHHGSLAGLQPSLSTHPSHWSLAASSPSISPGPVYTAP